MEKITVNELFSGIGAQRKAFERLGIPHEVVGISDIDKYANQSYEAIFGKTKNYGDISKVERLEYADLWTYSFPCQDISVAGMQKGISTNTRSGLLYEVQRLLEVAKSDGALPKYLLLENVKNLVGKQFKAQFNEWLRYLDELGYCTYWQVLNAKEHGIPQNRERVFAVSIRKDIDKKFLFPEKQILVSSLEDFLEDEVNESFYISQEKVSHLIEQLANKKCSNTIRTGGRGSYDRHTWDLVAIAASRGRNVENPSDRTAGAPTQQCLELNYTGCSNTITTVQKDNLVIEKSKIYQIPRGKNNGGLKEISPTITSSDFQHNNFVVESTDKIIKFPGNLYGDKDPQAGRVYHPKGLCPTLDTMSGGNRQPKIVVAGGAELRG